MKEEEKNIELIGLTVKKLSKEASQAELERIDILINDNQVNKATHDEVVRTWEASGKAHGITDQETDEEWQRLNDAIGKNTQKSGSFSMYRAAAAIALLVIGSALAYFFIQNSDTSIVADSIQSQVLEDGSSITLNSNTVLTYGNDFNKEKREVELNGEAYFEVESNKSKPFIIHAQGIDVTVIGTSFNVKAFENRDMSEVIVNSGIVEISSGTTSIELTKGERGVMMKKSGKLFKIQNDNPNFLSWKTQIFEFEDTPLLEVINLLNDVYNKSLYLANDQLGSCPITVLFDNQSFESILKVLETTLDLTIEETENGLKINGDNC